MGAYNQAVCQRINDIAEKLGLSKKVNETAIEIANALDWYTAKPSSIAAACVYLAGVVSGEYMEKQYIANNYQFDLLLENGNGEKIVERKVSTVSVWFWYKAIVKQLTGKRFDKTIISKELLLGEK